MEIKTYNSAQLSALVSSPGFKLMPVLPISTHRAISHIHNPRAEADDVLMIIAFEEEVMVGYLGVLADTIYNAEGTAFKCGWLSCMWVDPQVRGKGIAKQLIVTAFNSWNNHILVTEFTPEAKGLYDRTGNFNDLCINNGLRCYLRFNLHEVLPKKSERFKPFTSIIKLADSIANVPIDWRLSFIKPKPRAAFEAVTTIDESLDKYISTKQNHQLERRTTVDLNWIINYPWLLESAPTDESRKYHFSSVANRFKNLCFKLIDKGSVKAYLHFTIRNNHLKLPYAYFEKEYLPDVIQQIYKLMLDYKLNMLTVFNKELVTYFSSHPTPFIYKRVIKRHYIISKALDMHFKDKVNLHIQDGDADCAFT